MATDLSRREIAEQEVRELNLDYLVRAAARGGRYDGTANYDRRVFLPDGQLSVSCTSGAGTNSAVVWLGSELVYENSDYGRWLRVYRRGAWVEVIHKLAREQLKQEAVERLLRDVTAEQKEEDAFTPLDKSR